MDNELKVGIVGFDTSHVVAFTGLLNDASNPHHIPGAKVVVGFPSFSPDIATSYSRVENITHEMQEKFGVHIVRSVEEVLEEVDAILLESGDGRRHLQEVTPILKARKPVYIDKPLAANFADAAAIVELARENQSRFFSASSLRFETNIAAVKNSSELGKVLSCDAYSPATLEATNPGLFWYGIHGVEILYTFMGCGCEWVHCEANPQYHLVSGHWPDGRIATYRGIHSGAAGYGATVFGSKSIQRTGISNEVPLYSTLLKQVIPFFQGAPAPVAAEETLEIMAFMQAALVSERENRPVALAEVMEDCKAELLASNLVTI